MKGFTEMEHGFKCYEHFRDSKFWTVPGEVMHAFKPSICEAEADVALSLRPA